MRVSFAGQRQTFCLVYEPAPGHSVMISSFASLFVAKAKATPENVVPCVEKSRQSRLPGMTCVLQERRCDIQSRYRRLAELYFGCCPPLQPGACIEHQAWGLAEGVLEEDTQPVVHHNQGAHLEQEEEDRPWGSVTGDTRRQVHRC